MHWSIFGKLYLDLTLNDYTIWQFIYNGIVVVSLPITGFFDRCTDKTEVFSRYLVMAEFDFWCIRAWDKQTRGMDTTLNAVSAFRLFSTRYFGICQFLLRYCGIGYSPMSPSYSNSKAITKGRTTRSSPDSHCLEKKQAWILSLFKNTILSE